MPITYQKMIFRKDLRDNPNTFFVFGDNLLRLGLGGQAGQMRGEPNAIGVATKREPTMAPNAFFDDGSEEDWMQVEADLASLEEHLKMDRVVIVPEDGIGTGLSELPKRAPRIYRHIWHFFNSYSKNGCPWQKPE